MDDLTVQTPVNGDSVLTQARAIDPAPAPAGVPTAPDMGAVVVRFKKHAPVEIEIDADAMTWDDSLRFQLLRDQNADGKVSDEQLMEFINELLGRLTGQDVTKLPARVVNALLGELSKLAGGQAEDTKN